MNTSSDSGDSQSKSDGSRKGRGNEDERRRKRERVRAEVEESQNCQEPESRESAGPGLWKRLVPPASAKHCRSLCPWVPGGTPPLLFVTATLRTAKMTMGQE
jgi:hypothetical protein